MSCKFGLAKARNQPLMALSASFKTVRYQLVAGPPMGLASNVRYIGGAPMILISQLVQAGGQCSLRRCLVAQRCQISLGNKGGTHEHG